MLTITAVASAGTPPRPAICTSCGVVVAVPENTRAVGNGVYEPGAGEATAAASRPGAGTVAELGATVVASNPAIPMAHTDIKVTKRFIESPLSC